jgi:hypothetical protein
VTGVTLLGDTTFFSSAFGYVTGLALVVEDY